MFGLSALSQAPFSSLGSVAVVVALTGNAATGAVGNVTGGQPVTGVSSTGAVGTVTRGTTSLALSGVSSTGAVGNTGVTHTNSSTGNAATGAVGAMSPSTVDNEDGVVAVGAVGTVGVSIVLTDPLSGVESTLYAGTLIPAVSPTIIGVSATGEVGYVHTPWELINDSQTITWTTITAAPGSTWALIPDQQSVVWEIMEVEG